MTRRRTQDRRRLAQPRIDTPERRQKGADDKGHGDQRMRHRRQQQRRAPTTHRHNVAKPQRHRRCPQRQEKKRVEDGRQPAPGAGQQIGADCAEEETQQHRRQGKKQRVAHGHNWLDKKGALAAVDGQFHVVLQSPAGVAEGEAAPDQHQEGQEEQANRDNESPLYNPLSPTRMGCRCRLVNRPLFQGKAYPGLQAGIEGHHHKGQRHLHQAQKSRNWQVEEVDRLPIDLHFQRGKAQAPQNQNHAKAGKTEKKDQ